MVTMQPVITPTDSTHRARSSGIRICFISFRSYVQVPSHLHKGVRLPAYLCIPLGLRHLYPSHLFDGRRAHGMMTRVLQSVGEVLLRALNARRLGHPGQTNQARPPREGRTNSGFVVRV